MCVESGLCNALRKLLSRGAPKGWGDNSQVYPTTVQNAKTILSGYGFPEWDIGVSSALEFACHHTFSGYLWIAKNLP
jgi:hypothetical protein